MPRARQNTRDEWEAYWWHHEPAGTINRTPQMIKAIIGNVDLRGCRALEIGAGTGGNSSTLAAQGAAVTALDFSEAALERTITTGEKEGVELAAVQGDARCLPFGTGSFDLVFHQGFLEHFRDPSWLVKEQRRVLRTGGYILVDVPQRYNLYTVHKRRLMRMGRWPYGGWEREFSLGELQGLLQSAGFRIIDAYGRGYYPRCFEMLRNLQKIETKILRRRVLPEQAWRLYDAGWHRLEGSRAGCAVLQCVGVLGQAGACV